MELFRDKQGHLVMTQAQPEPICPKCSEPIRWVLDMASYSTLGEFGPGTGYILCHARCVWFRSAFTRERKLAQKLGE